MLDGRVDPAAGIWGVRHRAEFSSFARFKSTYMQDADSSVF